MDIHKNRYQICYPLPVSMKEKKSISFGIWFSFAISSFFEVALYVSGIIFNIYRIKQLIEFKLPVSTMDWIFLISTSTCYLMNTFTRIFALVVAIVYNSKEVKEFPKCMKLYFQIFYFIGLSLNTIVIAGMYILYVIDRKPDFRKFVQEIIATASVCGGVSMMLLIGSSVLFFTIIDNEIGDEYDIPTPQIQYVCIPRDNES